MNQGEFSFLLTLHEALQNQQVVSLGLLSNYYNWKSAMSVWMCVILCVRFKTGVSISHSHLVFPKGCPSIFQSKIFWRLIFAIQPHPGLGSSMSFWVPSFFCEKFCSCIILLFLGFIHTQAIRLDYILSPPLQLVLLLFLLHP